MGVNGVALVVCSQFGGENTWVEGERRGFDLLKNWLAVEKKLGGKKKVGEITIMMNAMSPGFNGSQLEWHFDVLLLFQVMEKGCRLGRFVATYFRYLVPHSSWSMAPLKKDSVSKPIFPLAPNGTHVPSTCGSTYSK